MSGSNDTSFLLANKINFDVRNAELTDITTHFTIKLDPLETAVLFDLVEQKGKLVSYEQLFRHWSSRYVSDGVLTRVVSSLRGKFKQFEGIQVTIQNRPKQGYQLSAQIEVQEKNDHKSDFSFTKAALLFVPVIVFALVALSYVDSDSDVYDAHLEYKPLVATDKRKAGLSFNPSFSHLAFGSLNPVTQKEELSIVNLNDGSVYSYEDEGDIYTPVWLNNEKIIYRSKKSQSCYLRIATLNESFEVQEAKDALPCNQDSMLGDIERLDDETILYTDSTIPYGPGHLFSMNLRTFQSKMIPFDNLLAAGIYKVVAAPGSDLIALLINDDFKSTEVRIVNLKSGDMNIASLRTSILNRSVAWDGKTLVVQAEAGRLEFFKLKGNKLEKSRSFPVFDLFNEVVNIPNGVAFIMGLHYSDQLFFQDYNSKITQQLTDLKNSDASMAFFTSENDIIFVTNSTGIAQVKKLELATGNMTQLSNFSKEKNIKIVHSSPDNSKLVLETNNGIEVYGVSIESPGMKLETKFEGIWPNISNDEVFYATKSDSIIQLNRYDFLTNEFSLVYEGAALGGRYKGQIIFAYDKRPGIWSLVEDSPELLVNTKGEVMELIVKGDQLHYRDTTGRHYVYDGQNSSPRALPPLGYKLEDLNESGMLLRKSTSNITKVVALQESKNIPE